MIRKSIILFTAVILFSLPLGLSTACDGAPSESTPEPIATSASETDGGDAAAEATEEPIITTPTPIPTPTPGPVTELVSEFAQSTGLARTTVLGLSVEDWINLGISVLILLVGYVVGTWLLNRILWRLVKRTPTEFDDAFLKRVEPEIGWFVVVISLQFASLRLEFLGAGLKDFLHSLYFALYLIIGLLVFWKLIDATTEWYVARLAEQPEEAERLNPVITLAHRAARILLLLIGAAMLLSHFGINITALAASLGIAGLALSLAAQDTLSDAISGFTILVDQPFRVGDRIEISELGTWGDVVQIGTRTTRIRTRDNRMVIVPNSTITIGTSQVVNYTYPDPRYRVQMDIGIGYGMDIEKTRRVIVDTVSHLDGVLKDKPVDALYNEMGESAMTFRVRWWIESYEDTRRIFDRVNSALQIALDGAAIEMPNPTYDVNLNLRGKDTAQFSQSLEGAG
jgi:small-conductance mechanosensitive channel